jgi:multidrug transporter EmrE-like cation transporter
MLFKLLGRMSIPLAVAVPLNYLACTMAGFWFSEQQVYSLNIIHTPWFLLSIMQGLFFFISFSLLALASQQIGVAVAALFSRLAMAVPVVVAFIFLGDTFNMAKFSGIVITLPSLVLVSHKNTLSVPCRRGRFLALALSLFCFHGIQLSIMNLAQHFFLVDDLGYHSYMAASFFFALLISSSVYCLRAFFENLPLRPGHLIAGFILGLVNYACVFNLIKALATPGWGGSKVFPLFSIGVVGGSALAARICFKESLSWVQWSGLSLGGLAVTMLSLG